MRIIIYLKQRRHLEEHSIQQPSSGGVISLTAGTNETFVSESNTDYIVHIITAPNGSATNGDILNVTGLTTVTPSGNTLTITDNTVIGGSAEVKVIATLTRTVTGEKIKTKNQHILLLLMQILHLVLNMEQHPNIKKYQSVTQMHIDYTQF